MRRRPVGREKPDQAARRIPVHPDLHKAIGYRSLEEDISMQEVLHRILCAEFDRLDLLNHDPADAAMSASSA